MISKLALKRLTASDLTFFEWHYKNRNAGNQKAINLNADVITGRLYPALNTIAKEHENRLAVDLWIAGPAAAEPVNLQRKIIKGTTYKNWRLDGEMVYNPEDAPERFNVLEAGDVALFEFVGELIPNRLTLLLVSKENASEQSLFHELNGLLGQQSMIALDDSDLGELCHRLAVPQSHPVWLMVSDEDLTEAALGQAPAVARIQKQPQFSRLSRAELQRLRQAAAELGRLGEELVDLHLSERLAADEIANYEWSSDINAISPYDFRIERSDLSEKLEIKTTAGDFSREFYISLNELREMAYGEEPYYIGRVYQASPVGAKLRYSKPLREYGRSILAAFSSLPSGVTANAVTISPDEAMFEEEIDLTPPIDDEE
jgi:hypothetical protein